MPPVVQPQHPSVGGEHPVFHRGVVPAGRLLPDGGQHAFPVVRVHHAVEAVAAGRRERLPRVSQQAQESFAHIVERLPFVAVVPEEAAGDVFDDRFKGTVQLFQPPGGAVLHPRDQPQAQQAHDDQEQEQAHDLAFHPAHVPEQGGCGDEGKDVPVRDAAQLAVRHEEGFAAVDELAAVPEQVRGPAAGARRRVRGGQLHDVGEMFEPDRAAPPEEDAPRAVRDHHLSGALEQPVVDGADELGHAARGEQGGFGPAVHPDGRGVDVDDVVVGPIHEQHFQRGFALERLPVILAVPHLKDEVVGGEGHALGGDEPHALELFEPHPLQKQGEHQVLIGQAEPAEDGGEGAHRVELALQFRLDDGGVLPGHFGELFLGLRFDAALGAGEIQQKDGAQENGRREAVQDVRAGFFPLRVIHESPGIGSGV